jgi:hypothetical protein
MNDRGSASTIRARGAQRRTLLLLILLFFAPLGLAFLFYYGHLGWRPAGHVNHGELIAPARPLPAVALPIAGPTGADARVSPDFLKGKWTLLYVGPGACPEQCRTELYYTRQVRTALNRDMDRVQRVFIAEGDCCDMNFLHEQHRDLVTVRATPEAAPLLALLPAPAAPAAPATADSSAPGTGDRIYLIDPLGNLMMWYPPQTPFKGMLEDLKRLLGLSHVG